ncbi:hypothetical protein ACQQ7H_10115 [Corynebacterium diphtheriae]
MEVWEQSDAVSNIIRRLSNAVPAPSMVQALVPKGWTPKAGVLITVEDDGTPIHSRAWTRQQVRVTVRARDMPTTGRVMRKLDAFLITPGVHNPGLPIKAAGGIIGGSDSRLSCFFSSSVYGISLPRKVTRL